jgi:hypothetical protein
VVPCTTVTSWMKRSHHDTRMNVPLSNVFALRRYPPSSSPSFLSTVFSVGGRARQYS